MYFVTQNEMGTNLAEFPDVDIGRSGSLQATVPISAITDGFTDVDLACPAGRYAENLGGSFGVNCARCPVGRYVAVAGAANCTACGVNEYAPIAGSTACSSCQEGNMFQAGYSSPGAAQCNPCVTASLGDFVAAAQQGFTVCPGSFVVMAMFILVPILLACCCWRCCVCRTRAAEKRLNHGQLMREHRLDSSAYSSSSEKGGWHRQDTGLSRFNSGEEQVNPIANRRGRDKDTFDDMTTSSSASAGSMRGGRIEMGTMDVAASPPYDARDRRVASVATKSGGKIRVALPPGPPPDTEPQLHQNNDRHRAGSTAVTRSMRASSFTPATSQNAPSVAMPEEPMVVLKERPATPPAGWEMYADESSGQWYYHHEASNTTSWIRPNDDGSTGLQSGTL